VGIESAEERDKNESWEKLLGGKLDENFSYRARVLRSYYMDDPAGFENVLNVPEEGDIEGNRVLILTVNYGRNWMFVNVEEEWSKSLALQEKYKHPIELGEALIDKIAKDLDLNESQRLEMIKNWTLFRDDEQAFINWFKGVQESDSVAAEFYNDPLKYMQELKQELTD